MKNSLIRTINSEMNSYLNNYQLEKLNEVLEYNLYKYDVIEVEKDKKADVDYAELFIASKKVEGCSERTLNYYKTTIDNMLDQINKEIKTVDTDDLRSYLTSYQEKNNCSKVTIDNVRRILSSFFSWLEDEDYIIKSPIRRIHKIKTTKVVRETYSDETIEKLRDSCEEIRDLALIDFLTSTGVRVGELVKLNKNDINFEDRSCIVFGKGSKEREVYFDARTKLHLEKYLSMRNDDNPALFVSLLSPYDRLEISGVEIRLRKLGRDLELQRVHPHKFRRTMATKAIYKGMPIEQVQRLLGHAKIDTTLQYAMVNQNNVKLSHHKYIC
jgi:site-specific recombinase XerD